MTNGSERIPERNRVIDRTLVMGTPVLFAHHLKRVVEYRDNPDWRESNRWGSARDEWKVWKRTPNNPHPLRPDEATDTRGGIIIGYRNLANGRRIWMSDEPIIFEPRERVTAYLVAYDMRANPVYVLPNDLIVSET